MLVGLRATPGLVCFIAKSRTFSSPWNYTNLVNRDFESAILKLHVSYVHDPPFEVCVLGSSMLGLHTFDSYRRKVDATLMRVAEGVEIGGECLTSVRGAFERAIVLPVTMSPRRFYVYFFLQKARA